MEGGRGERVANLLCRTLSKPLFLLLTLPYTHTTAFPIGRRLARYYIVSLLQLCWRHLAASQGI